MAKEQFDAYINNPCITFFTNHDLSENEIEQLKRFGEIVPYSNNAYFLSPAKRSIRSTLTEIQKLPFIEEAIKSEKAAPLTGIQDLM